MAAFNPDAILYQKPDPTLGGTVDVRWRESKENPRPGLDAVDLPFVTPRTIDQEATARATFA
jgi:hypothetical protein